MTCTCTKVIYILLTLTVIRTFELKCPEDLQRIYRRRYVCNASTEDRYSCLFDQDSDFYKESCKEGLDYVRPGQKYVISGRGRNTNCSSLKYQPFKFRSNRLSHCVFEKSTCGGIGQIVFGNGSLMSDRTCRCDYTAGYAFVTEPRNKCYCVPTEEDCMCYKVNCPRKKQLTQDYECSSSDMMSSIFNCTHIIGAEVESKASSTIKGKDQTVAKNVLGKLVVSGLIVLGRSYGEQMKYSIINRFRDTLKEENPNIILVKLFDKQITIVLLMAVIVFYHFTTQNVMIEEKNESQTDKISPEEAVEKLRIIIELLDHFLSNRNFDKDFQEELSAACPNYTDVLRTYKRDLLKNDCGIVIAGETSAGKTTLINLLVGKDMFVTSNIAATGTVCRIRHSKSMKIKIYSKDESLIDEEMAGDLSGLKTLIKKYTVVERNPQEMVDVFLPVPILKGNVIIVDTPGIGENNELCDILMDFLPHAVSFVFIINAKNAGGIHEDRLLRILKTVIEKQKEMPCFEPEDVIFLTNQWDIIDNIKEDGDEEDEHTKTWNKIQYKLAEGWPCFHADRIFKISLKQVGEGLNTHTTREFKTFKTMLDATIEKNKNKRVEYYFRFIQKFAINAEMGIMSRIHLLEISDDDRTKQILKTKETIQKLKTVAQEKLKEAKEYKTEVIKKLAEQLLSYLHSDNVQNDILNPPSRKRINLEPIVSFRKEVLTRINMGISKWCAGEDVILVIQEIESKIKTLLSEVESIIRIIDEDLAGFSRSIHDVSFNVFKQSALRMTLISNGSCIIELVKLVLNRPSLDNRQLMKEKQAHNMYKACLSTLTFDHIRSCFEDNFGTEYDSVISRFEFEILQNTIGLYTTINKNLFELSDNKKKTQSFTVLHGLVNEIKTKIDEFKAGAQL